MQTVAVDCINDKKAIGCLLQTIRRTLTQGISDLLLYTICCFFEVRSKNLGFVVAYLYQFERLFLFHTIYIIILMLIFDLCCISIETDNSIVNFCFEFTEYFPMQILHP